MAPTTLQATPLRRRRLIYLENPCNAPRVRQEKRIARRAATGADADTSAIRAPPQSALEGAGLADFSDIGPTLELHDELKCLESEAVHLTATVRAALAHARRHAIDVARSLCPPHTTASTGRTPPVDSPIGVALKVVFGRNVCRRLGFALCLSHLATH